MTTRAFAVLAIACSAGAHADQVLWDGGITPDGVTATVVASPRLPHVRIVDEFVVPEGTVWVVTGFRYVLVVDDGWQDGGITQVCLWSDSGGSGPLEEMYDEQHPHAGRLVGRFFGRDAHEFTAEGLNLVLTPGTYWIGPEMPAADGPGHAYWMTSSVDDVRREGDLSWFSPSAGESWCRHDVMGWDGDYWHQAFQVIGFDVANAAAPAADTSRAHERPSEPPAPRPGPAGRRDAPIDALSRAAHTAPAVDLLWDNDIIANGFMGRAISPPLFPDIRVADDFVVGEDGWLIESLHLSVIEDAGWSHGDMLDFYIHAHDGGSGGPGELLLSATAPRFERMATGRQIFDREEYHYWAEGLDVALEEGRYWIGFRNAEGAGAGTNYWPTSDGGQGQGTWGFFSLDAGKTWQSQGAGWDMGFEVRGVVGAGVAVLPIDLRVTRGVRVAGGLVSLAASDDNYLAVRARRPPEVSQPSVQVEVDGFVGDATVGSLSFTVEASTTLPDNDQARQWIDLYDFETDRWERLDTRTASNDDQTVIVTIDEGAERYVDPDTFIVRGRVSFYDPGISVVGWFGRIDLTRWRVR